mmetsp:Transcript_51659/g.130622  ORF Transcript_51659/g.130622 Transcript_51659/m.130622 type:complete len:254 (-) Transcript_51659:459-1220(-)
MFSEVAGSPVARKASPTTSGGIGSVEAAAPSGPEDAAATSRRARMASSGVVTAATAAFATLAAGCGGAPPDGGCGTATPGCCCCCCCCCNCCCCTIARAARSTFSGVAGTPMLVSACPKISGGGAPAPGPAACSKAIPTCSGVGGEAAVGLCPGGGGPGVAAADAAATAGSSCAAWMTAATTSAVGAGPDGSAARSALAAFSGVAGKPAARSAWPRTSGGGTPKPGPATSSRVAMTCSGDDMTSAAVEGKGSC